MKKNTNKTLKKVLKAYQLFSLMYTGYTFLKARGLKKEDDRYLVGKAIDRIGGYNVGADDVITIDDTDLHVSYNPYLQLFTGSLGSIAVVINGTTEVYTDNNFRNMTKETQYAILCHELGHYKLEHKPGIAYQFDRLKAIWNNQVLPMELEADEYAASIVGPNTMIIALCDLGKISGVSKKELILRIENLLNKKEKLKCKFESNIDIIFNDNYEAWKRETTNVWIAKSKYQSLVDFYIAPRKALKDLVAILTEIIKKRGDK